MNSLSESTLGYRYATVIIVGISQTGNAMSVPMKSVKVTRFFSVFKVLPILSSLKFLRAKVVVSSPSF